MQQQISRRDAGPQHGDEQAHHERLPEDNGRMRVRKRHHPRIENGNRQRRNREEKSNHRSREAHVKQRLAIVNRRANANERAKRSDQRRRGKEIRVARGNSVIAARKKMSQFVRQQNADQREGERDAGEQKLRVREQGRIRGKKLHRNQAIARTRRRMRIALRPPAWKSRSARKAESQSRAISAACEPPDFPSTDWEADPRRAPPE